MLIAKILYTVAKIYLNVTFVLAILPWLYFSQYIESPLLMTPPLPSETRSICDLIFCFFHTYLPLLLISVPITIFLGVIGFKLGIVMATFICINEIPKMLM